MRTLKPVKRCDSLGNLPRHFVQSSPSRVRDASKKFVRPCVFGRGLSRGPCRGLFPCSSPWITVSARFFRAGGCFKKKISLQSQLCLRSVQPVLGPVQPGHVLPCHVLRRVQGHVQRRVQRHVQRRGLLRVQRRGQRRRLVPCRVHVLRGWFSAVSVPQSGLKRGRFFDFFFFRFSAPVFWD